MYTLMRTPGLRRTLSTEAPSLVISMAIAEPLYRFHSFLLESAAFLATWFLVGALVASVRGLLGRRGPATQLAVGEVRGD